MIKKHEGHICYCDRVDGAYVPTTTPSDTSVEFYVGGAGTSLWRRLLSIGGDGVVCKTGAWQIYEFCESKRCKVPEATARVLEAQSAAAGQVRQFAGASKGKSMKNENGKSVVQVWEELFVENEKRKEKLTDEQLADAFSKHFPNSKSRPRPGMFRNCYNAGTYMYKLLGKPESRGLPTSRRYDEKGQEIPFGKHKAVIDNDTGDPDRIPLSRVMKEQAAKKKVVKKAVKKASAKTKKR